MNEAMPEIVSYDGKYAMNLPDGGDLFYIMFQKGRKIFHQVTVQRDNDSIPQITKEVPVWVDVHAWVKAPITLRIKPALWDFFRLEVRKAIDRRALDEEEKRQEEALAREERRQKADEEFRERQALFEEARKEREKYLAGEHSPEEIEAFYVANPQLRPQPEPQPEALDQSEAERPGLYGITARDLSETYEDENGELHVSPTARQAAIAVLEKMPLCTRLSDSKRQVYVLAPQGNVWTPDGLRQIERVIDKALPSIISTEKFQKEVRRRVLNEILETTNERVFRNFEEFHGLVGLLDGKVADLWTGMVRERTSEDLILEDQVIPVLHDPNATCPHIEKWLKDTLDKQSSIDTILDFMVAILDRRAWKAILVNVGRRDSGKSVFKKLETAFFGTKTSIPMGLDAIAKERFATARLYDARVVFIAEAQSRTDKEGEKRPIPIDSLKRITGDDQTEGEMKYVQDSRKWTPTVQPQLDTNGPPLFDSDDAFVERLRPVTWPFTFVSASDYVKLKGDPQIKLADRGIIDTLTTPQELSGLLNLLLKRSPALMKTTFVSRDETAFSRYEGQTDSSKEFCSKYLTLIESKPENEIFSVILYKFYEAYCKVQLNVKPQSSSKFFKYLSDFSFSGSHPIGDSRRMGYDCFRFDENKFNEDQEEFAVEAAKKKM
jgi:phage/plasmid-associated DNA primase